MLFRKTQPAIVIGCGRFGASLANNLCEKGYDVVVLDKNPRAFDLLPDSYSGYEITADGSDIQALEQAGAKRAVMVAAATGNDCVNSLACQIASRVYHVKNVYMRLANPELEQVIAGYGIQVIYPFRLSMHEFERLSGIEMEDV